MFGLPSPVLLIGAAIAVALYTGTVYYKGDSSGFHRAQADFAEEKRQLADALQKQKDEATGILVRALEDKSAAERALADFTHQSEERHAKDSALLAASGQRYDRLGLFYDRLRGSCGAGGGNAQGGGPAGPGVAGGGAGEVGRDAVIPGADGESVGVVIRDADQLKLDFLACADHAIGLPDQVNGRPGS